MLLSAAAAAVLLSVAAALMANPAAVASLENQIQYKTQLAELTRISTLLQKQPTAELMKTQAQLQHSVNMLGSKLGFSAPQQARAPQAGMLPPAPAPAASHTVGHYERRAVEARAVKLLHRAPPPGAPAAPDAAESVAAARQREVVRAHERLGERTAWIEALLGDGEAADAVAPSDAGRSAAEVAASAAAAEAAARGTPFDGEAEAIAQARREADDELRALGGCTTPEELEAARAAYERAHPGVFVRKEQGLLLRADVPFPAADRYAAVNFASL